MSRKDNCQQELDEIEKKFNEIKQLAMFYLEMKFNIEYVTERFIRNLNRLRESFPSLNINDTLF